MKIIQGNILEAQEPIIIHQVNCMNKMGSGVAKALYTKYPDVKSRYHKFNERNKDQDLLGSVDVFRAFTKNHSDSKIIANCYSQYNYGSDGKLYTDYNAVNKCFEFLATRTKGDIAIPYGYGCGLGGGEWSIISMFINSILKDRAVVYKLES
jgi:O-acetyl-ADP-ribose deacetylase (regulator of RNase III)